MVSTQGYERQGADTMEQTRFTTFNECLDYVRLSLGIYANDHNVVTIAREAFTFDEKKQAFVLSIEESEYWKLVEARAYDD